MTKGYIKYRSDYKYQLAFPYQINIPIKPPMDIVTDFIELNQNGELTVKEGYAWDGPSGPVIDTPQNMRAALVHDALYQLMRHQKLSARVHRKTADKLFRDICKKDGVTSIRANIYYEVLRKYGRPNTSPQNKKKIHRAPEADRG